MRTQRDTLIDWLNAFKADPFSTGVDRVDRLLEVIASVDTHPKGGDAKQAPSPMSGAVAKPDAQGPSA